jgi:hypothetical protein
MALKKHCSPHADITVLGIFPANEDPDAVDSTFDILTGAATSKAHK